MKTQDFRSIAKRGFGFCASGPSQESRDADYARSESNMRLLVAGSAYAVKPAQGPVRLLASFVVRLRLVRPVAAGLGALMAMTICAGCFGPADKPLDTENPAVSPSDLQAEAEVRAGQSSNRAREFAPELLEAARMFLEQAEATSVDGDARTLLADADRCLRDAEHVARLKTREHRIPFPSDRSLGKIYFSPWGKYEWRFSAQARGDIVVKPETMTWLEANPEFGEADLTFLTTLEPGAIQYLALGHTKVPAGVLAGLKEIRGLRDLSLAGAGYTTGYLPHIRACPWLRMVNVLGNHLSDQELTVLQGMPAVEALAMDCPSLTDAAFETIASFLDLKTLITRSFDAGDRGLAHLPRCQKLEQLWVAGAGVTDASIPVLKQHASLRELVLIGTSVTDDGIRELGSALPECKIDRL
jgi:hypothetical protein